jgi:hypothetical protein
VGDTFRLRVADKGVLKIVSPRYADGNPYFCGDAASGKWRNPCNA